MGWAKCVPRAACFWIGLDDLGMCVADDHGAVAEMEVDVLVAVDVPEAVAPSVIGEDRVRRRVLPARRDAAGDVAVGDRPVGDARRVLGFEGRLFVRDQFVDLSRSNSVIAMVELASWGRSGSVWV